MQFIPTIEIGLLFAVTLLLLWAAVTDVRHRLISNKVVIAILGLFGFWATLQLTKDVDIYGAVVWPLIAAGVVFAVGAGLFALRLMGGGDVKLLAVMALFAGPALSVPFVLYVVVAGGFVALGTLFYARLKHRRDDAPPKVPYGVAIMAGGMWVCFQRFSVLSV